LIAFGPATQSNPLVADAEFFSLIEWDAAAPKALRRSAQAGDWQRVIKFLTARADTARREINPANGAAHKPSLWSLHDLDCPESARRLVETWQAFKPTSASRRQLAAATEGWLTSAANARPILPLELLVLFEIVREAGSQFPLELSARLWRALLETAVDEIGPAATKAASMDGALRNGDVLSRIALEAELSWQAGLLFEPVAGSAALRDAGRAALWGLLSGLTDSSGIPAGRSLGDLPAWMTSIVRARAWGRSFSAPLFSTLQEKRVRGVIDAIAKLCRTDGRPALCAGETNGLAGVWSTAAASLPPRQRETSSAARYLLSLDGRDENRQRRKRALRNGQRSRKGRLDSSRPVFQSDESRLACLRSDWSGEPSSILVSYHVRFPRLEASLAGRVVFAGDWEIEVRLDGREVEPGEWTCVCWHSDDDGDYLELQSRAADVRIERQIFLSRTDEFALVADVVASEQEGRIDYVSRLPLASDCGTAAQTRTRECRLLFGGAAPARVFPLGLDCDRIDAAAGQLSAGDGGLTLQQTGVGGLYAPLVLDWNPRRRRSPASWRRVTVALNGSAVPGTDASGFLLETGPSKWLIYRSLQPTLEPRSVLGQHTMYETLMGNFVRGDVEVLIQVEQTPVEQASETGNESGG
jgi:hypothetical protein